MKRAGFIAILLACLTGAAEAERRRLPPPNAGIIGEDDRVIADSTIVPWASVGRVSHAGYRMIESCTGTLIAPRLVLTAAHCLFDPFTDQQLPLHSLHFVIGMRRSDLFLDHAKARCVHQLGKGNPAPGSVRDAAVIVLDKEMKQPPMAIASGKLETGTIVSHAGYGQNRRYALSLHAGCRVTWNDRLFLETDCDTNFGQSGGPVLVEEDGTWKLAGIMVALNSEGRNLGLAVDAWRELAEKGACE